MLPDNEATRSLREVDYAPCLCGVFAVKVSGGHQIRNKSSVRTFLVSSLMLFLTAQLCR